MNVEKNIKEYTPSPQERRAQVGALADLPLLEGRLAVLPEGRRTLLQSAIDDLSSAHVPLVLAKDSTLDTAERLPLPEEIQTRARRVLDGLLGQAGR